MIKKAGGAIKESYLEPGFILEKRIGVGMPKRLEKCKVLQQTFWLQQEIQMLNLLRMP